jgi:hypothetical protein
MGTVRLPGIAVEGDVEGKEEGEAVLMYYSVLQDLGVLEDVLYCRWDRKEMM